MSLGCGTGGRGGRRRRRRRALQEPHQLPLFLLLLPLHSLRESLRRLIQSGQLPSAICQQVVVELGELLELPLFSLLGLRRQRFVVLRGTWRNHSNGCSITRERGPSWRASVLPTASCPWTARAPKKPRGPWRTCAPWRASGPLIARSPTEPRRPSQRACSPQWPRGPWKPRGPRRAHARWEPRGSCDSRLLKEFLYFSGFFCRF